MRFVAARAALLNTRSLPSFSCKTPIGIISRPARSTANLYRITAVLLFGPTVDHTVDPIPLGRALIVIFRILRSVIGVNCHAISRLISSGWVSGATEKCRDVSIREDCNGWMVEGLVSFQHMDAIGSFR